MVIAVALWIIAGLAVCAIVAPKIREHNDRENMLAHTYTAHGRISSAPMDKKTELGYSPSGIAFSTSGDITTFFTSRSHDVKSGFTVHFLENFVSSDVDKGKSYNDQLVTLFKSLYKDQVNPFLHYYHGNLEDMDGTLTYAIDRNGVKRYISFKLDKA